MILRDLTADAHRRYRTDKHPARDAEPRLEVVSISGLHRVVGIVQRRDVAEAAERQRDPRPEALIYSSDAVRRRIGDDGPNGDGLEEVLCTMGVAADGDLSAVVTAYRTGERGIVFGREEWDTLLDATVVEDLRKAFQW